MNERLAVLTSRMTPSAEPASAEEIQQFRNDVGGVLPDDYLELLRHINGACGDVSEDGPYVGLHPLQDVLNETEGCELRKSLRGAILMGTDGIGGAYVLLTHKKKPEIILTRLSDPAHKPYWTRLGDSLQIFLENLLERALAEKEDRDPIYRKSLSQRKRRPKKKKTAKLAAGEPGLLQEFSSADYYGQCQLRDDNIMLMSDIGGLKAIDLESGQEQVSIVFRSSTAHSHDDRLVAIHPHGRVAYFNPIGQDREPTTQLRAVSIDSYDANRVSEDSPPFDVSDRDVLGWVSTTKDGRLLFFDTWMTDGESPSQYVWWDTQKQQARHVSAGEDWQDIPAWAISPDGKWSICVGRPHRFNPERNFLLPVDTAIHPEIYVIKTESQQLVHRFPLLQKGFENRPGFADHILFSPVGEKITHVSRRHIATWDLTSGKSLLACERLKGVTTPAAIYSRDGQFIITAEQQAGIHVYSAKTGELVHKYDDRKAKASSVTQAPDPTQFVSKSSRRSKCYFGFWQLPQV